MIVKNPGRASAILHRRRRRGPRRCRVSIRGQGRRYYCWMDSQAASNGGGRCHAAPLSCHAALVDPSLFFLPLSPARCCTTNASHSVMSFVSSLSPHPPPYPCGAPLTAPRSRGRPTPAIDRAALSACVVGNPAALARLEGLVHPLVAAEKTRFLQEVNGTARCQWWLFGEWCAEGLSSSPSLPTLQKGGGQ